MEFAASFQVLYQTSTLEMVTGHGHTKFVLPHIYCGGQLLLANYGNSPPQPQTEIPERVSHPFNARFSNHG